MCKAMYLKFAIIIEIIHLGSLYLCGMQKLENTSLVSFEIWKVVSTQDLQTGVFPKTLTLVVF